MVEAGQWDEGDVVVVESAGHTKTEGEEIRDAVFYQKPILVQLKVRWLKPSEYISLK